jgi:hypothetical protein
MYLQGFLLSPPVSRDELLPVMRNLPQRLRSLAATADAGRTPEAARAADAARAKNNVTPLASAGARGS